jgi:hypothetical protein
MWCTRTARRRACLGRLAAWKLRVPVVVHTVHGAPFHPYQPWAARRFFIACERYAARRCHHLISVADAMTDLLVDMLVAPREKFTTIYSGMDVEPFSRQPITREATREALGIRARTGGDWQDRPPVSAQGTRRPHRGGSAGGPPGAPKFASCWWATGFSARSWSPSIASAGSDVHFRFTGLVAPERIPSVDRGHGHSGAHEPARGAGSRASSRADRRKTGGQLRHRWGTRGRVVPDITGYLIPPGESICSARPSVRLAQPILACRTRLGGEGSRRFTARFRHEYMTAEIRKLYLSLPSEGTWSRPTEIRGKKLPPSWGRLPFQDPRTGSSFAVRPVRIN